MDLATKNYRKDLLSLILAREVDQFDDESSRQDELNAANLEVELLISCFDFAFREGLSYENVEIFLRFYHQLVKDTVVQDLSVNDAVLLIRQRTTELVSLNNFKEIFLLSCVDFIAQSLIQHYHLLVFGLCYTRQQEVHVHDVLVDVQPYDVIVLNDGKQIDQWQLEQSLKMQEEFYVEEKKALQITMAEMIAKIEDELENYFTSLTAHDAAQSIDFATITEIVQNSIIKRCQVTETEVEFALDRSRLLLENHMEKLAIQSNFPKGTLKTSDKSLVPPSPTKKGNSRQSSARKNKK